MKKIIVEPQIFEKFPDFTRGIIIVRDIKNAASNAEIEKILQEAITQEVGRHSVDSALVNAWDRVHAAFGSNPNKFPPSIKSLIKRIDKGGSIPFINSVVALFNYISIKHLIPCGGDDVQKIEGNLLLGFAVGNEPFIPLGGGEKENPDPGEVIYYDDRSLNIMCRRWNWRNGDFTKITPETKEMVINIDGIGPAGRDLILSARDELLNLLTVHCGADATADVLYEGKTEVECEIG
jgi:lysyl-tRNA synthetase class 2